MLHLYNSPVHPIILGLLNDSLAWAAGNCWGGGYTGRLQHMGWHIQWWGLVFLFGLRAENMYGL